MFGLGFGEVVLLAVIALLVIGPDQLPGFARNVARFLNELKRTTEEFKKELNMDEGVNSALEELKQLRAENLLKEKPKAEDSALEAEKKASLEQNKAQTLEEDQSSLPTDKMSQPSEEISDSSKGTSKHE